MDEVVWDSMGTGNHLFGSSTTYEDFASRETACSNGR